MPDYRSLYDNLYIYAFDLDGRDVTVTISEVKAGKIKDNEGKEVRKPVVFFRESKDKRGLVLCKTNAHTIGDMYGRKTEAWVGKRITLYPTTTTAYGKVVDCIRIRPAVPASRTASGTLGATPTSPAPEAPEHAEIREPGQEG